MKTEEKIRVLTQMVQDLIAENSIETGESASKSDEKVSSNRESNRPTKYNTLVRYEKVAGQIIDMRDRGLSYQAIADDLNKAGVTTARGAQWTATAILRAEKAIKTHEKSPAVSGENIRMNIDDINTLSRDEQIKLIREYPPRISLIDNQSELLQIIAMSKTHNGHIIKFFRNPSETVQIAAVSRTPSAIQFIENPSEAVQTLAVGLNPQNFRHIENPSDELKALAVSLSPRPIQFIEAGLEDQGSIWDIIAPTDKD